MIMMAVKTYEGRFEFFEGYDFKYRAQVRITAQMDGNPDPEKQEPIVLILGMEVDHLRMLKGDTWFDIKMDTIAHILDDFHREINNQIDNDYDLRFDE